MKLNKLERGLDIFLLTVALVLTGYEGTDVRGPHSGLCEFWVFFGDATGGVRGSARGQAGKAVSLPLSDLRCSLDSL